MSAAPAHKPIVHFVGSIPLPDAETVFRTLAAATGSHLRRLPDGETGIRKTWIGFLRSICFWSDVCSSVVVICRAFAPPSTP
jgi:hypothetical protein